MSFKMMTLAAMLAAANATAADAPQRTPAATTPHYAFYSDYETNLNDAMIQAGLARHRKKAEIFHSGDEQACFEKLPPSVQAAWDAAVDFYAKIISPRDFSSREQYLIRIQLAGFHDEEDLKAETAQQFLGIAASFRAAATPAYKTCRWTIQDEKNRRWIGEIKPRVAEHEAKIAPRLEKLYQKPWPRLPIPIDIVETVNWSGATTILHPTDHVLISTEYQGDQALEVVFHESSHLLMERTDPIWETLKKAATAADYELPRDLWHVVQFYTTGEVVRHELDAESKTKYTPMVYEMFKRPGDTWVRYREALESKWLPYVEGKRTLPQAAASLIEEIRKLPEPEKK